MAIIKDRTFDEERALYGLSNIAVLNCRFDGPADGESALKECNNAEVKDSFFNLRYPFWHDTDLELSGCELTPLCRAAIWYSKNIIIKDCKLHGIKALRECENTRIEDSSIDSFEFGWFSDNTVIRNTDVVSEYFMLHSKNLAFENVRMQAKYVFQYVENSTFNNINVTTKDAFWHAKNIYVKNSVIDGEYLAWYSEDVTFENCIIKGTQPLCYCKGLKLINCVLEDADFSFEKSEVEATIKSNVLSIRNPASGRIKVKSVGEIIKDDPASNCVIEITGASEAL